MLRCPATPGRVVSFIGPGCPFAGAFDILLFHGSIERTNLAYGERAAPYTITDERCRYDDVQFLCGHGPGSTIGAERRSNPFLRG